MSETFKIGDKVSEPRTERDGGVTVEDARASLIVVNERRVLAAADVAALDAEIASLRAQMAVPS